MYITNIYMPVHKTLTFSPSLCCAVLSCLSGVQLFAAPWTIAHQALLSMGFFRQEHRSGLPLPFQGSNPQLLRLRHCRWILHPLSHRGLVYAHMWNVANMGYFVCMRTTSMLTVLLFFCLFLLISPFFFSSPTPSHILPFTLGKRCQPSRIYPSVFFLYIH